MEGGVRITKIGPAGMTGCYFIRDGAHLIPDRPAQGPWGPSVSGNVVGGLLARAVESEGLPDQFQPARLTVEILKPVAMDQPIETITSLVRSGRLLRVVDAQLRQCGDVVARCSATFLRPGAQPAGDIWSTQVPMPPLPADFGPQAEAMPMFVWGYGGGAESRGALGFDQWCDASTGKFAWMREVRPLVEDEPLTPFVRAAMAADATSALTHWSSDGLRFINTDYTMSLSRLPTGIHVGLAAVLHTSDRGIGSGVAALFDENGPIGNAMAVAVVSPAAFHGAMDRIG